MKKTYVCIAFAMTLIFSSCSKDNLDDVTNEETVVTDVDGVSNNLLIALASEIPGDIPESKGNISFELDETALDGYLKTGFSITFTPPENYAGLYLQLKSEDGTKASEYWNIPYFPISKKTHNDSDKVTVNVGFTDQIPPGKFCVDLSTYDDEGNVTEKKESCVTTHQWGGNEGLSGTYNFISQEVNLLPDLEAGVERCYDGAYECDNEIIPVEVEDAFCYTRNSLFITLKADGTYEWQENKKTTGLDLSESEETCSTVFRPELEETFTSKGMWSYHGLNQLVLIQFEFENVQVGGETQDQELENGLPFINGKIENPIIVDNGLLELLFISKETNEDDGDLIKMLLKQEENED